MVFLVLRSRLGGIAVWKEYLRSSCAERIKRRGNGKVKSAGLLFWRQIYSRRKSKMDTCERCKLAHWHRVFCSRTRNIASCYLFTCFHNLLRRRFAGYDTVLSICGSISKYQLLMHAIFHGWLAPTCFPTGSLNGQHHGSSFMRPKARPLKKKPRSWLAAFWEGMWNVPRIGEQDGLVPIFLSAFNFLIFAKHALPIGRVLIIMRWLIFTCTGFGSIVHGVDSIKDMSHNYLAAVALCTAFKSFMDDYKLIFGLFHPRNNSNINQKLILCEFLKKIKYTHLSLFFFVQAMSLGLWFEIWISPLGLTEGERRCRNGSQQLQHQQDITLVYMNEYQRCVE